MHGETLKYFYHISCFLSSPSSACVFFFFLQCCLSSFFPLIIFFKQPVLGICDGPSGWSMTIYLGLVVWHLQYTALAIVGCYGD